MFSLLRQWQEGGLILESLELDVNSGGYPFDNSGFSDYTGSVSGADFDYFGYGLVDDGTVPNGTRDHAW